MILKRNVDMLFSHTINRIHIQYFFPTTELRFVQPRW